MSHAALNVMATLNFIGAVLALGLGPLSAMNGQYANFVWLTLLGVLNLLCCIAWVRERDA